MNILVSACLLGMGCRYDGKEKMCEEMTALLGEHHLIPVCPEIYGGLPTPRGRAERKGDRVVTQEGQDVTAEFEKGARDLLKLAKLFHCELAILKEKSPSCGFGKIYDGTFSGTLTDGDGIFAELLAQNGIRVIGESQIPFIIPQ